MNPLSICFSAEPLEARIAPSTAFAVTPGNVLLVFDTDTPGTIDATMSVTGLGANETLRGIDFRPATSELFGITVTTGSAANSILKTYRIDPDTGAALLVGATAAAVAGAADVPTGFDFNPAVDRMRYINTNDENARLNPSNGTLAGNDTDLTPAPTTSIIGAAYDRNFADTQVTTLYVIDRNDSQLGIQGGLNGSPSPNGGVITDLAPLGFNLNQVNDGGFDIELVTDLAFAALSDAADNLTRLYTIDLVTAVSPNPVASAVGLIGNGTTQVFSIAIAPAQAVTVVNDTTATFTEFDGDRVTVKVSAGTLDDADFLVAVKQNGGLELRGLNFSDDATEFDDANVTVSVKRGPQGDGHASVGYINATGIDLGKVKVPGDLGQIDAVNVVSISARSFGQLGLATQATGSTSSDLTGELGSLKIARNFREVTLNVGGDLQSVKIGGSMIGDRTSAAATIIGGGRIESVKIGGDITGGGTATVGGIYSNGVGGIGNVTIGGSIYAADNPVIIGSAGKIGAIKIGGDMIGNLVNPVRITALGAIDPATEADALAIKSIKIGGSVSHALILSGYTVSQVGTNPDTQIGKVTVLGDWTASSIAASVLANANGFGNADDTAIADNTDSVVSRLAGVVIKGAVSGTPGTIDHFGFVAQQVDSLKVGARKFPLTAGNSNDDPDANDPALLIGIGGDTRVHEV